MMIARFGFLQAKKGVWEVVKISTGPWVQYADYEQALAEKDREIQQIREHEFQRGYQEAEEKYQQLMEKAVRFAERLDAMDKGSEVHWNDVEEFLNSPEVQAWKERQP